ncbi:hypothetical protein VTK26DRAFT_168 [Humicola hyalothermophila]
MTPLRGLELELDILGRAGLRWPEFPLRCFSGAWHTGSYYYYASLYGQLLCFLSTPLPSQRQISQTKS